MIRVTHYTTVKHWVKRQIIRKHFLWCWWSQFEPRMRETAWKSVDRWEKSHKLRSIHWKHNRYIWKGEDCDDDDDGSRKFWWIFGATTFTIMTLSIKTLTIKGLFVTLSITTFSINDTQHNSTLSVIIAEYRIWFIVTQSVIMLNDVMLSVVMLSVIMLSVVILSVVAPNFWLCQKHLIKNSRGYYFHWSEFVELTFC